MIRAHVSFGSQPQYLRLEELRKNERESQDECAKLAVRQRQHETKLAELKDKIREGKKAEAAGQYFHPAVNGEIDELTEGYSSVIQLKSLLENAKLAEWL